MIRTVDRGSSVPLHSQIKQILIEELKAMTASDAQALTEASLIKRFNVSRAPIRQALKDLTDEGYVVRHRAKGTFPVQGLNVRLPSALELGGISRYLAEQGLKPTSRVVEVARAPAPEEVAQALGLEGPEDLLRLQRVIYVNDAPLVWACTYLRTPESFLPSIKELERSGTVFPMIDEKFGIRFTLGEQTLWASAAGKDEADALEIEVGAPVLVAVTTMVTSSGQPGGWRRAVHRADEFKYTVGLGR
ncbi:MAG: GntR family transcriptional regulator [Pseudorhodobacter sp.]|nr:MAG: GntR family transcriptional regulator [Pseudorhodobacter sp.]